MRAVITHTAIILTLSLLLYFWQSETNAWFAYYHSELAKGQVWRLITAHFCHTNGYHLLMNAIGLVVVTTLFIDTFKKYRLLPLFAFSGAFICFILFFFEKNIQSYVGLSGVLHGLFAFAVCDELKRREKWGMILGLGFICKIMWEQINGPSASTESLIAARVLINAHLYGAISGVIYFLLIQLPVQVKKLKNITH